MRKRTTTGQLNSAITNNLLQIAKVEVYYKTSRKTETMHTDTFKDSLEFLCETIFSPCIGWYYEWNYMTGNYEFDCGLMNPNTDIVIIAHLYANDGVSDAEINESLLFQEE